MWIECFAQDERVDGDDIDALIDDMLRHVRSAHDVPYHDDEVRAWARNFAEASRRQTGPTERLDAIGPIEVHPVTPDRIDDWLQFFDHEAFADNPDWASCYCLSPHTGEDAERPWRDIRADMIERLRAGATLGYLAYVDGHVAGWVNASPRATYRKYADVDPGGPDPARVAGVSCFVVAPPYRRHGVSSALLDRVVADAAARGLTHVEGYPVDAEGSSDAAQFRGPRGLFAARDFRPVEEKERYTVVRRDV
ncbi:GNAT family N-acetyltransferase [Microbacterium sp. 10M-3C3]|jgi:GNAT superfamily N-acetyltransferase|uniref:GNAT family N-acetyltransferase n=1 Tax=Microbacterium sp. 10M-3C3 TaxID=2483401 RepID=UPI000F64158F|nr:GNAT family N-acetyltransferase [Microbacterium sp. 10M-3C3]